MVRLTSAERKYLLSFLILSIVILDSVAQNLAFEISPADSSQGIPAGYSFPKSVPDSLSGLKTTRELINLLQSNGYLMANVDSISIEDGTFHSRVYVGERYQWGRIAFRDAEGNARSEIKNKKWVENTGANSAFSKAIQHSNNNGYPFASVRMDSVTISNGTVNGLAILDSGPLVAFDTLLIQPNNKNRTKYLSKYLKILPGKPYNEKAVRQIPDNLNLTPYYQLTGPVEMVFHNNNARINFAVEKISANRLDGVIGLLPNSSGNGKALLTGELNLELLNLFESGKEFSIHWQRMREETQMIDLAFKVPGVLNSFDLLAKYYQLKEDTTFVNRVARLGIIFNISPRSSFSFFTDIKSAGLLSNEPDVNNMVPNNADFDLTTFGIGYGYKNLNRSNLFDDGISLEIELSAGNRKINRNPVYPDEIYENLDLKSSFYHLESTGIYQHIFGKNWQFYQRLKTGFLFNETLFSNDLFRLGGFSSLRGFNENFFFASDFLMSNSELRLFFEESSYLFAFVDQAWMKFRDDRNSTQYPLGFGFGLQLGTRSGDFTMSYALGRSSNSPINLNQSKIHFGLISRF